MSERTRRPDEQEPRDNAPADSSDELDQRRDAGLQFLDAADEAIARALSQDSSEFLSAGRQQGGQ